MGDLSAHFSGWEFDCRHGGKPHECPSLFQALDPALIACLERIRADLVTHGALPRGGLRIISGKRCPWWNRKQKGARQSQHLLGRAADLPRGLVTPSLARACGARGIGIASDGSVVHVDTRSGRKATWHY